MFDAATQVDAELAQSVSAATLHFARDVDAPPIDAGESDLPDAGKRDGNEARRYRQLSKESIAKGFDAIGKPELSLRIRNCCLKFYKHVHEHGARYVAYECGVSVCPDRERRDARRHAASVQRRLVRFLNKHPGSQCLMLTVSAGRAVPAHELRAAVSKVMRMFASLMQRARVKRAVLAWVRKVELARNPTSSLWIAHIHAILVVPAEYFRRAAGFYIKQEEWAQLVQKQLRVEYKPVVDVRVLQGVKAPLDDEGKASLREAVKYDTKPRSLVVSRKARPVLVGSDKPELYDAGDGQGLRPYLYVPLRAVPDATKGRRMLSMSRNLQGDDDLELGEFPEDLEGADRPADLGEFICTEIYVWRVRGLDADFFLVGRTFDDKQGRLAMTP